MIFFFSFTVVVIVQRLAELLIAKRNAKKMLSLGAEEADSSGYRYIVIMHTAFFVSLVSEKVFLSRDTGDYWYIYMALFAAAQFLRYWTIYTLGMFWNTRIIVLEGAARIGKGPYKYLSHPNYAAVITELAVIPLMFSCYITAILFSVLNLFVLKRRIRIENFTLSKSML